MPLATIPFFFSVSFDAPARVFYDWATDFQPDDPKLMGHSWKRKVKPVSNGTVILSGGPVARQRLVQLYPDRLRWTNTHLSGPNKHSQFLYEVKAEGKNACRLDFTGRQVEELPKVNEKIVAARSRKIAKEDAATWKKLARAFAAHVKAARKG
jgi:hypothetical protein